MMTPYVFIELLIWRGANVQNVDAQMVVAYFANLMDRGRIIAMYKGDTLDGFASFFLLDRAEDLPRFTQKPMWATPSDTERGGLVFFDKLVSNRWTLAARRSLQEELLHDHPQLTQACWQRPRRGREPTLTHYWRPGCGAHL